MNHDDHKPDLSTLIDPELEARIVAWVSNEASPFEAAELTRLTGEKPELAIFKRRIEAVRGLVAEAIHPDKEPLLLSPDRRAKLLQALGAPENHVSPKKSASTVVLPMAATKRKQRINRNWMLGLAASLVVGLFTVLSIPSFQKIRSSSKMVELSLVEPRSEDAPSLSYSAPAAVAPEPDSVEADQNVQPLRGGEFKKSAAMHDSMSREKAYKSAIGDASKRKLEQEKKGRIDAQLQSNGSASGALVAVPMPPQVAQDGSNFPVDQRRQYGALRSEPSAASYYINPTSAPTPKSGAQDSLTGWSASSTLAGTRLNTELRDAASSVAVVTKDFLKDVGATDNKGLLAYTTNSEVGGAKGNFAAPQSNTPSTAFNFENQSSLGDKEISAAAAVGSDADKIVLSPFAVTAKEDDVGYAAKNSLADARTKQPESTFAEVNATKEPVSTFSLHVSDVSFRLAQAALAKGEELDRASIRPEEFYNAFNYGDPTPAISEKVSCRVEQAAHPFVQQRNLVRIAVKVAAAGRDAAQPLHLTVLLDTSGSMEREDRAATVHSAMQALISLLGPNDRLTLIGFARQPRLLAESLPGDQAATILNIIKNTPAEGGTNLEEALKLGSELAHRQFDAAAQNRIVILTDGAANLGNANPAQLAASIETLRQQGIAFDACGVGLEGLDDNMLETLTRKGDGRYYVLNTPEAADAGFAKQLAGAFRPAAENVKLQVRFNPARVGNYRLIGFEQHRLREEDFRNDKVDAAELAAEEAAVAVYQVEALPQGEGELGEVYVRFRDASSGNMVERSWTLNYDPQAPAFDRATPTMQLAGVASLLAEKLRGGQAGDAIKLSDLAPVVNKLRSHYANEPRVQELVTMFEQARKLAGE